MDVYNENEKHFPQEIREMYSNIHVIGNGRFGVVYSAKDINNNIIAIKQVSYSNEHHVKRELDLLTEMNHPYITKLYKHFISTNNDTNEVYCHFILEYLPECLSNILHVLYQKKKQMEMIYVKLYSFQLLRTLSYIRALRICHRDIKPQNILIDRKSNIIKLCDFGSARKMEQNEKHYSYICTRFYRAPELIFGSTTYSFQIDMWSMGCILGELVLARPLFPGESDSDQLFEIINVLGVPTKEQIIKMNPDYKGKEFPGGLNKSGKQWKKVFRRKNVTEEYLDLISKILVYEPEKRLTPLQAMCHSFYDELKNVGKELPNGEKIQKELFEFTQEEINSDKESINLILSSLR